MPSCAAIKCGNKPGSKNSRYDAKVSFHKFPKNEALKSKWIQNIGREYFQPSDSSVLCSMHFDAHWFKPEETERPRLKPHAIPTIFGKGPKKLRKWASKRDVKKKPPIPKKNRVNLVNIMKTSGRCLRFCFCGFKTFDVQELSIHAELNVCRIYKCNCGAYDCKLCTHKSSCLEYHNQVGMYKCELCHVEELFPYTEYVSHMRVDHKIKTSEDGYRNSVIQWQKKNVKTTLKRKWNDDALTSPSDDKSGGNKEPRNKKAKKFGCPAEKSCTYVCNQPITLQNHLRKKHSRKYKSTDLYSESVMRDIIKTAQETVMNVDHEMERHEMGDILTTPCEPISEADFSSHDNLTQDDLASSIEIKVENCKFDDSIGFEENQFGEGHGEVESVPEQQIERDSRESLVQWETSEGVFIKPDLNEDLDSLN